MPAGSVLFAWAINAFTCSDVWTAFAPGAEVQNDVGRRYTVQPAEPAVGLRSRLPRVPRRERAAVRHQAAPGHDVAELLRLNQPSRGNHRVLIIGSLGRGGCPTAPAGF